MKLPVWLMLPAALWSCHPGKGNGKVQGSDTIASMPAVAVAAKAYGAPPPGIPASTWAQMHAQDSIFEDSSRPTSWEAAGFTDPVAFKCFFVRFREWVTKDNVDSITNHIQFPLHLAGSPAWFREEYPHIFNHRVKSALYRQRLDRIFRNGQGAMVGNGTIWFVQNQGQYWVSAVN